MTVNTASARYEGLGKAGVIDAPYGFGTRFGDERGTNPEEMIAAAHASCFTMATSFALAGAGQEDGTLETECRVTLQPEGDSFTVTKSELKLTGQVPGCPRERFEELAQGAKANCPISKLLNCEITLETAFQG